MVLHKQLRVLNWGTPVKVINDDSVIFEDSARIILQTIQKGGLYRDSFVKSVKIIADIKPFLEIRVRLK